MNLIHSAICKQNLESGLRTGLKLVGNEEGGEGKGPPPLQSCVVKWTWRQRASFVFIHHSIYTEWSLTNVKLAIISYLQQYNLRLLQVFLTKYKLKYENVNVGKENDSFFELLFIQQLYLLHRRINFLNIFFPLGFLRRMVHSKIVGCWPRFLFFGGNLILPIHEHGDLQFKF